MDRTDDPEQQLLDLALRVQEALQVERCTLYEVDAERAEVRSRVALGIGGEGIRLPMRRGVVGFVARTGQTLRLKDAYNDPRFDRSVDRATGYRTRSLLTAPVRDWSGRVVGVLQALNKATGVFTPEDEQTLERFAREAAALLIPRPAISDPGTTVVS